jgi:phosphate-selective porin
MYRCRATIVAVLLNTWAACSLVALADEPLPVPWIGLEQAPAGVQRLPPILDSAVYNPAASTTPSADAGASGANLPRPADSDDRPSLKAFWDNGAVLESADKAFRLHVGGRFDFDTTFYHQSQDLPFLLQDGSDMRRARFRADGTIGEKVDFVMEVNFANIQDVTNEDTTAQVGSVGLTDFYATFKQVPVVQNVRIGHMHQPMGLEHLTSSNDWYYMERSPGNDAFLLPFNFVTGVEVFNSFCDDRITGVVAFDRVGKQDISPFSFGSGPGKYGVTGRATCLPFYDKEGRELLHLGIGYTYTGTENNFYAANRPLVRAGAGSQEVPNVIYTGMFYTPNAVQIADAEIATVIGRFSLSAEYQLAFGNDLYGQLNNGVFSDPRGDVTYRALYFEAGYFLNPDDYRRYDKKSGTWDRQLASCSDPAGQSHSAWLFRDHMPVQLTCRYSYLDLASGNPVLTPTSGAEAGWENDITLGCTWYINPEVHFMVNYVFTRLTYVDNTTGNINGLGFRLHVDF